MPTTLTPEIISAAILGFEEQKRHIETRIAELRAVLSGAPAGSAVAGPEAPERKRRKMSAAGRKAIAEAQRKRWAAAKKPTEPAPHEAAKPKRKLSEAGRKAIADATRKRWAAVKSAKAQQAKAAARKPARKRATKGTASVPVPTAPQTAG